MMRRSHFWLAAIALAVLVLPVQTGTAAVYEAPHYRAQPMVSGGPCGIGYAPCGESPCAKLSRGVTNSLTGWMEIPKHVFVGSFNNNVQPLDGFFVGLFRGTGRAIERTGIGLYETATFFMPGCGPLLNPTYVSMEPGCMNWRYGAYCNSCPSYGPSGPYYGNIGRPAPQAQAPAAAGSSSARSAGNAGGAAGVSYPDDYLR